MTKPLENPNAKPAQLTEDEIEAIQDLNRFGWNLAEVTSELAKIKYGEVTSRDSRIPFDVQDIGFDRLLQAATSGYIVTEETDEEPETEDEIDINIRPVIGGWTLSNSGGVAVLDMNDDEMTVRWFDEPNVTVCPIEHEVNEDSGEIEACIRIGELTLFLSSCMRTNL